MKRKGWRFLPVLAAAGFLFAAAASAGTQAPTIRLFPTTVVENIKATGESARAMEESLQGTIKDLEQQMELYRQSKCEGAEADEGCAEIAKQMGQKYLDMLTRMDSKLPDMEVSVRATRDSLEKRLRTELGRQMTPRGLQKLLANEGRPAPGPRPGPRGGRLSEKFRQYYNLVALGPRGGAGGSLAVVASDIYLDTDEVLNLIAVTRDEIGRARLHDRAGPDLRAHHAPDVRDGGGGERGDLRRGRRLRPDPRAAAG